MSQAALAIETLASRFESTAPVDTVDLVHHIAHELRQPLSTIESIAYYLNLVLPREEPQVRQQLQRLQQLVEQSSWIVSNAVSLTHPVEPTLEQLDLSEIVSRWAADSASGAQPIELRAPGSLRPVLLDAAQIGHLLENLLHFFRSASDAREPIIVSTSTTEEGVELRIAARLREEALRDTNAILESLAPVGSRGCARQPHAARAAGLALSLANVRRIVEAHGARICSSAVAGLSITVTFPAA